MLKFKDLKVNNRTICNTINTKYVWFDCEKDGFTIHGTNEPMNKPFFIKNGSCARTFLPIQIMNAYGIQNGKKITVAAVGPVDMKVFKKQVKTPEYNNSLCDRVKTAADEGEEVCEILMRGNAIKSFWKKTDFEKGDLVLMNLDKRNRTQITFTKVRSGGAAWHREQVKMLYGRAQQYCPQDRMNYLFEAGHTVTFPKWFLKEVFADNGIAHKLRLEKIRKNQYRLVPLENCQLTGEAIDYCKEIAKVIHLSKEAVANKEELVESVKRMHTFRAKVTTLNGEYWDNDSQIKTLTKRNDALESVFGKGVSVEYAMRNIAKIGGNA